MVVEAVQRRAVKAVTSLRSKTYEDRLIELGMDTLEERRKRGDLIEAFKTFSGKNNVDPKTWFTMCKEQNVGARTRKKAGFWNVDEKEWSREIRRNIWSVRVIEPWNSLPDLIKQQESVNGFKNAVDNFFGWGGQKKRRVP